MSTHHFRSIAQLTARLPQGGQLCTSIKVMAARIENEAAALDAAINKPSEMDSQLARNIKVSAAKTKLAATVAEAKTRAAALIATERFNINQNRSQQANLQPNAFAQEIRAVARSMPTAERLQLLNNAIETLDGATVAALCDAPPITSGLTAQQASGYRAAYLEKAVPMDVAYIDEVSETSTVIFDTAGEFAS